MKKVTSNNKEEFIIYQYEDKKINNEEESERLYNKISKTQRKNAKIFSLAIFLYCFSITYLISTLEFFEKKEAEIAWLLSTIFIDIIATILLIYHNKKRPKEGKIIYKHKDKKSFIVGLIFGFLGFIITVAEIDNTVAILIGLTLLDVAIALDLYHDRTGGNLKLGFIKEFIISIVVFLAAFAIGLFIQSKVQEEDFTYEYSKSANVIYDEIDRPTLIAKTDNFWYTFTNKYNTNHYELSVSDKPENLNIVYEIDDVKITNVQANDNYAVWSEYSKGMLTYAYYDREENQPYELTSLEYNEEKPQVANLGLYKDNVYYEEINYDNKTVSLNVYNITNNEIATLYEINDLEEIDLPYNTINVEENNLLIAICYDGVLQIIHFDLDKYTSKGYKPTVINTNAYNATPFKVSYDDEKYALYYAKNKKENISIINKYGKTIDDTIVLNQDNYAFYDKIKLWDEKLYFVNYKHSGKLNPNDFKLVIYDLENKRKSEIESIFDFEIDGKNIYGLGYYKDELKNVRLYDIYN